MPADRTVDRNVLPYDKKRTGMKDEKNQGPVRRVVAALGRLLKDIEEILAIPFILVLYLSLVVVDHHDEAKKAREKRKEYERNEHGRQNEDTFRTTL